ncbi:hypothetical protein DNK44_12930 [Pseudomonas dryadis]|uniref:Uncharacterized protein n=1 Tax=Phytopseudomonas dryadis TaxID=2487520 RepID=A0A4V2KC66_9GAMM|nr:hypothetical protein DNK44_12930 [Pseudomonas dryadis]
MAATDMLVSSAGADVTARGALSGAMGCSIEWMSGAAVGKSPVVAVRGGVAGVCVHAAILGVLAVFGRKKQNPRSGGRPGVSRNCLVATLGC